MFEKIGGERRGGEREVKDEVNIQPKNFMYGMRVVLRPKDQSEWTELLCSFSLTVEIGDSVL